MKNHTHTAHTTGTQAQQPTAAATPHTAQHTQDFTGAVSGRLCFGLGFWRNKAQHPHRASTFLRKWDVQHQRRHTDRLRFFPRESPFRGVSRGVPPINIVRRPKNVWYFFDKNRENCIVQKRPSVTSLRKNPVGRNVLAVVLGRFGAKRWSPGAGSKFQLFGPRACGPCCGAVRLGAMCLRPVFAARSPQPAQRAARSARFAQGKPPPTLNAPLRVASLFAFLLSFSPTCLVQRMSVGIEKERRSAHTRFENEKLVPPPFGG